MHCNALAIERKWVLLGLPHTVKMIRLSMMRLQSKTMYQNKQAKLGFTTYYLRCLSFKNRNFEIIGHIFQKINHLFKNVTQLLATPPLQSLYC